ncbi:MAG: hypothetical protein ACXWLK_12920 [Rhizomicrobium sp.]
MAQCDRSISIAAIATVSEAFGIVARAIDGGSWREWMMPLFDPYRPELHYMRGPGPKWREKHGRGARGYASADASRFGTPAIG